jgi:hypothetical protein
MEFFFPKFIVKELMVRNEAAALLTLANVQKKSDTKMYKLDHTRFGVVKFCRTIICEYPIAEQIFNG